MKAEKELNSLNNQNSRNEINTIPELIARLEQFKELEQDWDTYVSEKISSGSISTAIQVIKMFGANNINIDQVFPMIDGGVQFEKDFENNSIEIEVNPNNELTLLVFDKESNLITEKDYNAFEINDLINIVNNNYGKIHHSGKR